MSDSDGPDPLSVPNLAAHQSESSAAQPPQPSSNSVQPNNDSAPSSVPNPAARLSESNPAQPPQPASSPVQPQPNNDSAQPAQANSTARLLNSNSNANTRSRPAASTHPKHQAAAPKKIKRHGRRVPLSADGIVSYHLAGMVSSLIQCTCRASADSSTSMTMTVTDFPLTVNGALSCFALCEQYTEFLRIFIPASACPNAR